MRIFTTYFSVIAASLLSSTSAFAQSTPSNSPAADEASATGLEEIVVTAQRRSESVLRVPLSITAVSDKALAATGIKEISSLSLTVPGMISQQGVGYTQLYIRGIGNAIYLGADPSVATFIDDTPRIYGSLTNTFVNVDRVEVLKGAQGGLYGRNATGGVINVVTKQPSDQLAAEARVSYGTKRTLDAAAYINVPLSDNVAANLSATRKSHAPYVTNLARSNPYPAGPLAGLLNARTSVPKLNNQDFWAVDGKLRFQFSDSFKLTIGGDFARKNDSLGNAWRQVDPATAYATYVGFMTAFGVGSAILPQAQAFPLTNRKFSAYVLGANFSKIDDYGGYGKAELSLDGVDLSSITSFRWNKTGYINNSGAGTVPLLDNNVFNKKRNFSQELRAVSTGDGPFHWLGGATYLTDHFRANANGTVLGFFDTPVTSSLSKTKAWSVYAQGAYDFTEQLTLTASLRYVDERKTVTYLTAVPVDRAEAKSHKLLPAATLSYNLDGGTLYARYAKGFKTGGVNPLVERRVFTSTFGSVFKPEQVDTYEVGYRAQLFDRTVQFTSAVFYNDYKNIQVVANGTGPAITYAIINAQSARTYGAEAGLTWRVAAPVTISTNLGYLNAKYKTFVVPVQADIIAANASGNRMQLAPKWQGSFTVNLDQPVSNDLRLVGTALYSYLSSFYFEERNLPIGRQKGYSLVNTRIGVATTDNRYAAYVYVNNLFNKQYSAFGSIASAYGTQLVPGDRRIIGATVEVKF